MVTCHVNNPIFHLSMLKTAAIKRRPLSDQPTSEASVRTVGLCPAIAKPSTREKVFGRTCLAVKLSLTN
jgi:hypothetical protein